jgi:H+/Cl- antiporter ClcA
VALAFIELTHFFKRRGARLAAWMRLALGGALVVVLWRFAGTSDYLGLGVPGILRAFHDAALPTEAFALKLLFTSVTVGLGFIGGEVTPLFFVGASLGNVLSRILALPLGLSAAVGLAAVFGAAANAPLALAVMAAELSGWQVFPYALLVCVGAFLLTGMRGIYPAQRAHRHKHGQALERPGALRDL